MSALLHGAAPNHESAARIRRALTAPSATPDRLGIARLDARLRSVAMELAAPAPLRPVRQVLDELETLKAQRAELEGAPIETDPVAADEAIDWLASLGKLWDDTTRRAVARSQSRSSAGSVQWIAASPASRQRRTQNAAGSCSHCPRR